MWDNVSKRRHKCTHIPALWLFIKTNGSCKDLVYLPVLKYKHINFLIFIWCSSPQGCLEVVLSRQVEVDGLSSLTQEALEETCISSHISVTATQLIAQYHSLLLNIQVRLRLVYVSIIYIKITRTQPIFKSESVNHKCCCFVFGQYWLLRWYPRWNLIKYIL